MEAARSFAISVTEHQSTDFISQKIWIFLKTAVKTSKLDLQLVGTHRQTLSSELLQVNMWHHCEIQFWLLQVVMKQSESNYGKQQNRWYFH
jgi:hypothetical protein